MDHNEYQVITGFCELADFGVLQLLDCMHECVQCSKTLSLLFWGLNHTSRTYEKLNRATSQLLKNLQLTMANKHETNS